MLSYTNITAEEMDFFLTEQGFTAINLKNISEAVYSKLIAHNTCIRVYTGIVDGNNRPTGSNAIRVVIVKRYANGDICPVSGVVSRVVKTENWRCDLKKRLISALAIYKSASYATAGV